MSENEFKRIKDFRAKHRKYWGANASAEENPLRGLCRCSECGTVMGRNKIRRTRGGPPWIGLRCRKVGCPATSIRFDVVEKAIVEAICAEADKLVAAAENSDPDISSPEMLALLDQREKLATMLQETGLESLSAAIEEVDLKISELHSSELETIEDRGELIDLIKDVADPEVFAEMTEKERGYFFREIVKVVIVDAINKKVVSVQMNS